MRERDQISSVAFLIISISSCLGASRLGLGSFDHPSTGFFPFVLGMVIGILSLASLVKTIAFKKEIAERKKPLWLEAARKKKIFVALLSLIFYGIVLEKLGYTFTTFLFILFLTKVMEAEKWLIAIGSALLASIGSFILFDLCLNVPLPRGLFGI